MLKRHVCHSYSSSCRVSMQIVMLLCLAVSRCPTAVGWMVLRFFSSANNICCLARGPIVTSITGNSVITKEMIFYQPERKGLIFEYDVY